MVRLIRVHTVGQAEREVTLQEAEKILEDTYNDPYGGLVADARTGTVIWHIDPKVEEIIVLHILGGG